MNTHSQYTGRLAAAGGIGALVLGAAGIRRLGIECERAWLAALNAPPEPFELALFEEMRRSGPGGEHTAAEKPVLRTLPVEYEAAARVRADQPFFRPRSDLRASPRRAAVR